MAREGALRAEGAAALVEASHGITLERGMPVRSQGANVGGAGAMGAMGAYRLCAEGMVVAARAYAVAIVDGRGKPPADK